MRKALLIALLAMAAAQPIAGSPAQAAPSAALTCPATDAAGHKLVVGGTGTLYLGDPSKHGSQAPDSDNGRTSVYLMPQGGAGYFLACNYAGSASPTVFPVPASVTVCRQDRTDFVCK